MGFLDALFKPRTPAAVHTLKWPLPELRYSVPVDDAQKAVAQLKKLNAHFVAGGTFTDAVHAKDCGGGALGYFFVRTDDKTQNERLLFDGYMLQETEKLGATLESGPGMAKSLKAIGYQQAFERHVTVWAFTYQLLPVKVYSIDDFGDFVEIAVPQTKLQTLRDSQDKKAKDLAKKFAKNDQDILPTDVTTLQFSATMDAKQAQQQQPGGPGGQGQMPDDGQEGYPDDAGNQPRSKGRGSLF